MRLACASESTRIGSVLRRLEARKSSRTVRSPPTPAPTASERSVDVRRATSMRSRWVAAVTRRLRSLSTASVRRAPPTTRSASRCAGVAIESASAPTRTRSISSRWSSAEMVATRRSGARTTPSTVRSAAMVAGVWTDRCVGVRRATSRRSSASVAARRRAAPPSSRSVRSAPATATSAAKCAAGATESAVALRVARSISCRECAE